jgi:hypothetical protein
MKSKKELKSKARENANVYERVEQALLNSGIVSEEIVYPDDKHREILIHVNKLFGRGNSPAKTNYVNQLIGRGVLPKNAHKIIRDRQLIFRRKYRTESNNSGIVSGENVNEPVDFYGLTPEDIERRNRMASRVGGRVYQDIKSLRQNNSKRKFPQLPKDKDIVEKALLNSGIVSEEIVDEPVDPNVLTPKEIKQRKRDASLVRGYIYQQIKSLRQRGKDSRRSNNSKPKLPKKGIVEKALLNSGIVSEEIVNPDNRGTMTKAEIIKRDRIARSRKVKAKIRATKGNDTDENARYRYATFITMMMRGGKKGAAQPGEKRRTKKSKKAKAAPKKKEKTAEQKLKDQKKLIRSLDRGRDEAKKKARKAEAAAKKITKSRKSKGRA